VLVPARRAVRLPTPAGTASTIAAATSKVRDHAVSSSGRRLTSGCTGAAWATSGASTCEPGVSATSWLPARRRAVP
jgi:hypothetical protein